MSVPNLQVVVVCGKNEALKQDLLSLQKQNSDALKVFGYVENIDELFRIYFLYDYEAGRNNIK